LLSDSISSTTSSGSQCATSVAEQPQRPRVDLHHRSLLFPAGQASSGHVTDAGSGLGVASIRSVHGKRLTSSVPLDELFSAPMTSDARHPQAGTAQRRLAYSHMPSSTAHDSDRRSSVDCCRVVNRQPLLASFTQRALDDNSISSTGGDRMSHISAITHLNTHGLVTSGTTSHVGPAVPDHGVTSSTTGVRPLEDVHRVSSSAAGRSSRHAESVGRRRRPVSVIEFTTSPALPPPPPRARKPPLPDHIHRQTHITEASKPSNYTDEQLQRLTRVDEDARLGDVQHHDKSDLTRACDAVTESFAPVAQSSDMAPYVNRCCTTVYNNSVLKASAANRPDSQYAIPSVSPPQCDSSGQSEGVCTDVGSFAQRLSQLKTLYDIPGGGHRAQADEPVNCTVSTAGERVNYPPCDDVSSCVTRGRYQQDPVCTYVPASVTVHGGEVRDSAELDESLNVDNTDEPVVSDDVGLVLLPPPPEFDDDFNLTVPSCSAAVPAGLSDHVTDGRHLDDWSADEVCSWLDAVGLRQHCACFRTRNINGVRLTTLGRSELIALGLTDVHDRMTFERALRKVLKS